MAEPGDLIEISRGAYNHWALFIGDGYVIHITADGATNEDVLMGIGASIGVSAAVTAIVKKQKLKEILALGEIWCVNNSLDKKYKVKPTDIILKEAELLVGTEVPYHILTNNCEHFVTNLRYGKPESRQAREAVETGVQYATFGALAVLGASLGLSRVSH